jgi:TldD protein
MGGPIGRRAFLHGVGCAACAAGITALHAPLSPAAAQAADDRLDPAERSRLADLALDLARQAGASYADLRIMRYRWQELNARENRLDRLDHGVVVGFGLRLLLDGAWGFAGGAVVDEVAIRLAAIAAAENAWALRRLGGVPVELETLPAVQDRWTMPIGLDPFAVADSEKSDLLLAVNAAAMKAGADFCSAWVSAIEEEKFFAGSTGSRIEQTRWRIQPGFRATATNKQTGRFAERASLAPPRGSGWEYVKALDLPREAEEAAAQAREKLSAKRVVPGRYDLVLHPTNVWLTMHESIGHSTELDRALGWEADLAGTSFVTPEQRGTLQYGSPLLNVMAERTQAGGLSTVGYDDDGIPCAGAGFPIIRDGVFVNYQMAIGQAHLIGERRSNACAYADGPGSFPIQRMPNISLQPNPKQTSLDDLIGGVDNGIYVVGDGSWSIDQQRYNFQFGGQLFYEIRNGKLGSMLVYAAYQAQSKQFWNALDGLGDASTSLLCGTMNCGKGQPMQSAPVSHGAVPARFRNIAVLNTARDDL